MMRKKTLHSLCPPVFLSPAPLNLSVYTFPIPDPLSTNGDEAWKVWVFRFITWWICQKKIVSTEDTLVNSASDWIQQIRVGGYEHYRHRRIITLTRFKIALHNIKQASKKKGNSINPLANIYIVLIAPMWRLITMTGELHKSFSKHLDRL